MAQLDSNKRQDKEKLLEQVWEADIKKGIQPLTDSKQIEELEVLIRVHSPNGKRDSFLFKLGINTGLRISDLLMLKVKHIRGKKIVNVPERKTSFRVKEDGTLSDKVKFKRIVFSNRMIADIKKYTEGMDDETYLFESRNKGRAITVRQAQRVFEKVAKLIKEDPLSSIPKDIEISTHIMRKIYAYKLYEITGDIEMVRRDLNHSSIAVTERYLGVENRGLDAIKEEFYI